MERPMRLGMYSPEIAAGSAAELFGKAKGYGLMQMQFDFASLTPEEMPESVSDDLLLEIAAEASQNGVEIAVVNGTYNMSHPDAAVREDGATRLREIARAARALSCRQVSLCAGTRTRESMWVKHRDNDTPDAWADMSRSMEKALVLADEYDLTLLLETEDSNVIDTPEKTRRLIEQMQSPRLRVIMDCANLFHRGTARRENVRDTIARGFDVLGEYVVCAHGKDVEEGEGLKFTGAGQGIVNFDFFLRKLEEIGYGGGMILHGIKREADVPGCIRYFRDVESRM